MSQIVIIADYVDGHICLSFSEFMETDFHVRSRNDNGNVV